MRRDHDWKQRLSRASFTVEAAMLMGIILFVILSVLYGARNIYNKTLLTAHAYEEAITKREKTVEGLWGEEESDISIELDELDPVSFLRKSQLLVHRFVNNYTIHAEYFSESASQKTQA